MFTDIRSKKILFCCHCILNQNAISDGTAVYPAAFRELIEAALQEDIGIVQLPCPELMCLGLDRGNPAGADDPVTVENTRIRRAMESGEPQARLQRLIDDTVYQIEEYRRYGFEILGILGANRSPNCGVESTSDHGEEIPGMGLFLGGLRARLDALGISIPMTGIKASEDVLQKLHALLE